MNDETLKLDDTALPTDLQDAAALVQRQLKQGLSRLDQRVSQLGQQEKRRRTIAAVLKIVSVISGVVIAIGFFSKSVLQVIGGLVPIMVGLERAFANLDSLLSVTAAKNAYERMRREIVASHNRGVVNVIRIRDRQPAEAADALIKLVESLRDQLAKAEQDIESGLAQRNYELLGRLSLEETK